MRAPILTSPHLGAFLESFCADPFQGRMTLPVLNKAACSGDGVGFVLHSEASAHAEEVRQMCRHIREGTETLLESHQAMMVPKRTADWSLRWAPNTRAVFSYRGKAPRFWNHIAFGLDMIALRRQFSDHSVSMTFNVVDDYVGSGFSYYIDLEGMAVLGLKRFMGLRDSITVDHIRVRLYSQWGVSRRDLVKDANTLKEVRNGPDNTSRMVDPSEKEAWMDTASLTSGLDMGGRFAAVEAYVNRTPGYAKEVVSIQDMFLDDEWGVDYMRSPLSPHLHDLWRFAAQEQMSHGDEMLRTSYFSLLQDVYRGKRNGVTPNQRMAQPSNLRQSLQVYTANDETV